MKKIILFVLVLASVKALAQPVINSDYNATAQSAGVLNSDFATLPVFTLSRGANQTWNLTLPVGNNTQTLTTTIYTTPPPGRYLTTCNMAQKLVSQNLEQDTYFNQSASGISALSARATMGGIDFIWNFTAPSYSLPYNLGFNQTLVQTSASFDSTNTGMDPNNYFRIYDTIQYEGYGTLTLNGTVYTNCVLLSSRYAEHKSSQATGPFTLNQYELAELLFAPGLGYPLVTNSKTIYPINVATRSVAYLSATTTSTKLELVKQLSIHPQPANDKIHLGLTGTGNATIYDLVGKQVAHIQYVDGVADVSSVQSGLYIVQVIANNQLYRAKLHIN